MIIFNSVKLTILCQVPNYCGYFHLVGCVFRFQLADVAVPLSKLRGIVI